LCNVYGTESDKCPYESHCTINTRQHEREKFRIWAAASDEGKYNDEDLEKGKTIEICILEALQ